jgi:AraC family transcriptional regulator
MSLRVSDPQCEFHRRCVARPSEGTRLFTDHIFAAMVAYLATTYGGLNRSMPSKGIHRRGMLTPRQERLVTSRLLDDITDAPGLAELASICDLSRRHFIRTFKQTTGQTPHRWLLMQRINKAKVLLHDTKLSILEVALDCGFADQSHFTRVFSTYLGISPGEWRRQRDE